MKTGFWNLFTKSLHRVVCRPFLPVFPDRLFGMTGSGLPCVPNRTTNNAALYDLRKLLDRFGNPIEIPELDELHAMAVAGFEHVEEFEGRGEARLQTGWTRKVKLLDRTPYVPCSGNITMRFPSPSSRLCSRLRPIRARTCRSSRKKNGTSTNEFGRRRC